MKPGATQGRQIAVGRIAVMAVFVLGALWAPAIGQSKSMFIYLQNVQAYLMIPFAGIFFFAFSGGAPMHRAFWRACLPRWYCARR
jgi:hypothetical protein